MKKKSIESKENIKHKKLNKKKMTEKEYRAKYERKIAFDEEDLYYDKG